MRNLILLIIAIILLSCEDDHSNLVINSFPTVLVYDSWTIKGSEVYDMNGKLSDYDSRFDVFEFMPFWAYDFLAVRNNFFGISYLDYDIWLTARVDTFRIYLYENFFETRPFEIPESLRVIDTGSDGNEKTLDDPQEIRSAITWTYYPNDGGFKVPLTAVRVFTRIEGGYDLYRMVGQSCATSFDREVLLDNLGPDEVLSLIEYEVNFAVEDVPEYQGIQDIFDY